ncbi:MAG: hypothetical protein R3Y52_03660 [Psittacicella sp.]
MPLPFLAIPVLLKGAAIAAGTVGTIVAAGGAIEASDANKLIKETNAKHSKNLRRFEYETEKSQLVMDRLGILELEVLSSFESFSNYIEKINNKPQFKRIDKNGFEIPSYDKNQLKEAHVGASILLGGLGGAALGTASGFAAAGGATSAMMALGTASTGTAIGTLSGAAATNATLAALGGGSIAAGGGGIAAGTAVLGAATLGVGLLVGGVVMAVTSSKLSEKAEEAENEMLRAEKEINKICNHLEELIRYANEHIESIQKVQKSYLYNLNLMEYLTSIKMDWNDYTYHEKKVIENTVNLVGILYEMCKVQMVLQIKDDVMVNSEDVKLLSAKSEAALELAKV